MTGPTLRPAGFEDDDGAADPQLVAALGAADGATPDMEVALMALVARSRWLVPVVTMPGDSVVDTAADTGADRAVDTAVNAVVNTVVNTVVNSLVNSVVDTAVVTLTGPDGQRALPVFTGVDALTAWDPAARPVPVPADRAAQAAVSEGCDVLVVDLGSPYTTVLRPSMVWALAQRREWVPAYRDPFVGQSVARALHAEPDVRTQALEAGQPGAGALVVVLGVRPGLGAPDVQALATRVGERLATDGELRARVDELVFRVIPA